MSRSKREVVVQSVESKDRKPEKPASVERLGATKELFMTKRAANDHNANSARG